MTSPPPPLQLTWHPQRRRRSSPPIGLKNLGNSCYISSVLQCLAATPPFAQFCLQNLHSIPCKQFFINQDKECCFCLIERQIYRILTINSLVEAPYKIFKCINLFSENFQSGRQEDAQEFLCHAIDACHDACIKVMKCELANGSMGIANWLKEERTVMKRIFGGEVLSQVKCLGCKAESNKTDEIMDVSLEIVRSDSLRDALAQFFQPELLDGNNKYRCESCKRLSIARKQLFIRQAPNVLVIHLKRFGGMHGGKINKNISFDEVLELSDFMLHACQDPVPEYSLFGSIVHSGLSPDSGHYYAYVKDASDRWYCCNDSHVSLSNAKEVLSEKVYILFYLRSNSKPKKLASSCNGWKSSDSNGNGVSGSKPVGMLKQTNSQANGVSTKSNGTTSINNGKMHAPQIKPITLKSLEAKRVALNTNGNIGIQKISSAREKPLSTESNGKTNTGNEVERVSTTPNGKFSSGSAEPSSMRAAFSSKGNECANSSDNKTHVQNGINIAGDKKANFDCHSIESPTGKHPTGDLAAASKTYKNKITENSVVHIEEPSSLLGVNISYSNKSSIRKRQLEEDIEKFQEVLSGEVHSQLHSCGWVNEVENFMRSKKKLCQQIAQSGSDKALIKEQLIHDAREVYISLIPEKLKHDLIQSLRYFFQEKSVIET